MNARFIVTLDIEVRAGTPPDPDVVKRYLSMCLGVPDEGGPWGVVDLEAVPYPDPEAIEDVKRILGERRNV